MQGAFFITHTVDEHSPLYDAAAPNHVSFKGVIRMFLSVVGTDVPDQAMQAGIVDMGLDSVVLNGTWQVSATRRVAVVKNYPVSIYMYWLKRVGLAERRERVCARPRAIRRV